MSEQSSTNDADNGALLSADFRFSNQQFSVEIVPEADVHWIEVWSHDSMQEPSQCVYAKDHPNYAEAYKEFYLILHDPAAYV